MLTGVCSYELICLVLVWGYLVGFCLRTGLFGFW